MSAGKTDQYLLRSQGDAAGPPSTSSLLQLGVGLVHGVMTVMRNPAVNCTVKPTHHDQVNVGEGGGL